MREYGYEPLDEQIVATLLSHESAMAMMGEGGVFWRKIFWKRYNNIGRN
jgi:hypothetical protein